MDWFSVLGFERVSDAVPSSVLGSVVGTEAWSTDHTLILTLMVLIADKD